MSARNEVEVLGRRAELTPSEASEVAGRIISAALQEAADVLEQRTLLCDDCPCTAELRSMAAAARTAQSAADPVIHCGRRRPHAAHGGGDDSYRCPGTGVQSGGAS